jgi:thiol:disulfide interchange protein/DsbC/DsbD-like thiol-disulfide interchange protein
MGMRFARALVGIACLVLTLPFAFAQSKTQATLLLADEAARPGDTVLAGVRLRMPDGWHTYWQNPGESGTATEIEWSLPAGVTAGAIQWPAPEKLVETDITTYVLHGDALLIVPLKLSPSAPKGPLTLKAKVRWMECSEMCVLGKAELQATLNIGDATKPSKDAALFDEARKNLPQKEAASQVQSWWETAAAASAKTRPWILEWTPAKDIAGADFIPFGSEKYVVQGATEKLTAPAGKIRLRKTVEKVEGGWPGQIGGVLIAQGAGGKLLGAYEVTLPVAAKAPEGATAPGVPTAAPVAGLGAGVLMLNLAFAFLGGLILNLMPCVLPVIALKIVSFVKQSGNSPAETRKLGLIYGLGVLVSLLAFAGLVIAAKRATGEASWSMLFQKPQFLVAITTLITLVALNLFGVFEVTLGGGAMDVAGTLAAKEGAPGAFFNGVLAVVLATPCTAPFLATALGVAFAQPPAVIVLSFAAVALGLAFPYVLLSFFPGLLRFLPKPGAWMEKFKIAMGFPMLATAVWLFSVTRSLVGKDGALRFSLFLVVLALAAWIWGEFVQRGTKRRVVAMALAAVLVSASGLYAALTPADQIAWQPWSASAVQAARAAKRPVLVDFTADSCLTCQANKKTSLEITSVREKLKAIDAVTLLGDYTREDPAITAELQRFSRPGVPLVLVYPKEASKPPIVLPVVLTPSIVLKALDQAAQ